MQLFVMAGDAAVGLDQRLGDIVSDKGGVGLVLRIALACHAGKDRRPARRRHLAKPVDRRVVVQRLGHLVDPVETGTGVVERAEFGKDDKIDRPAGGQLSVDGGRDAVCMRVPFGCGGHGRNIDLAGQQGHASVQFSHPVLPGPSFWGERRCVLMVSDFLSLGVSRETVS